MNWFELGILFIIALVSTVLLVSPVKRLAQKLDAIDYPDQRRINTKPIPRLGGIAIFGGITVSLLFLLIGMRFWGWESPFISQPGTSVNYIGVGFGVLLIFIVGVIDDIFSLKPALKLLGQTISACIVAGSGLLLSSIYNSFAGSFIEFGVLSYPITVFYLVAFANIINLIDGLDGLASGITVIAAVTICIFAVSTGRPDAAIFSVALIGACIGFLRYNFYPASIFMGDSGSLLLGFSLGVISLFAVARSALFVSLLVPILAAGVPIVDTVLAIIRRNISKQPIQQADSGHIHHRLLKAGFSQKKTVLIMWAWTGVLALCAILITETHGIARIPIICVVVGVTVFAIIKFDLLGPVLRHHYYPQEKKQGQRKKNRKKKDGDSS